MSRQLITLGDSSDMSHPQCKRHVTAFFKVFHNQQLKFLKFHYLTLLYNVKQSLPGVGGACKVLQLQYFGAPYVDPMPRNSRKCAVTKPFEQIMKNSTVS